MTDPKSLNYDQAAQQVRDAWCQAHPAAADAVQSWPQAVLDDAVIVSVDGTLYRVPYAADDASVLFAEPDGWVPVTVAYVPVTVAPVVEALADAAVEQQAEAAATPDNPDPDMDGDDDTDPMGDTDALGDDDPDPFKAATQNKDGCTAACFLVADDPKKPSTWHLQVKGPDGKPDHRLMGAAYAALTTGYRGNTYDGPNKREALAKLKKLYAAEKMPWPGKDDGATKDEGADDTEPTMKSLPVAFATDSTKWMPIDNPYVIRVPGVRWSGQDLVGDTFDRDTDIGRSRSFVGMPAYYDHAQRGIKSQIGQVVGAEEDDEGIDFLVELDRSRQYVDDIRKLYREKALGGSTGAPGHLVTRTGGKLKRWVISEISVTPTPAEPRTHASFKTAPIQETSMSDNPTTGASVEDIGALKSAVSALTTETTALKAELTELKALPATKATDLGGAIGGGLNARADEIAGDYHYMKALRSFSFAGQPTREQEYPEGVFGGFVKAVFNTYKASRTVAGDAIKAIEEIYGASSDNEAAKSLGTSAGVSGAYLIPEQFIPTLMQIARQNDVIYGRTMVIPADGGEIVIPALDLSGSFVEGQSQYYGGVTIAWSSDDADPTLTQPNFNQIRLKTNAMKATTRIKNQLMMRSAISIDAVVSNLLGSAIGRARDYAILRGTGVGQPLGVLNSPATIDAGGSAIDFPTLNGMEDSVIPERDENYIWVIHTKKRSSINTLQQTNNTLVTYLPDLRGKPGRQLLGREVVYTDKLPYSASDVSNTVNLIDPTAIVVAEFQGIALAVSDQARFEQDETVIRAILSLDAQPWMKSKIAVTSDPLYVSGFVTI